MQTWSSSQSTPHTCSPSWGTTVAGAPCHLYIYQRRIQNSLKYWPKAGYDRDKTWQDRYRQGYGMTEKTQNREKTGQGAIIEW